ncbi:gustatory receptor for sugar taste 43a-like [Anticarsia gemmatalis]|uniref:gustatory receptor for sugar taste 43a-like n=1 Tax=Anticarsia gemmatalis TaxID=129554 RepID=UPI003F76521F
MGLKKPLRTECTVTGMLATVLYVCRIGGICPLKFKRVRDGWQIRTSRIYSFYGNTLVFIAISLVLVAFVADLAIDTETSLKTATNSLLLVWILDVAIVELVLFFGAYTGLNRMAQMIDCLAKLKDINKELHSYHAPLSKTSKNWWSFFIVYLMVWGTSCLFINFSLFMNKIVAIHGKVVTSSFYIFHNIFSCLMLQLLVIEFGLIAMSVLSSLQLLNKCLEKLLQEIRNECLKPIPTTVHRLAYLYCSICDIVKQVNESYGLVLVLLVLSFLLHLVIELYYIITVGLFKGWRSDNYSAPVQTICAIYSLTKLMMVIEPCQRTHEQFNLTGYFIKQLLRYTPSEHFGMVHEIKRFYRHYMLKQISYSPLKLYILDRMLIAAIAGTVPTYLIVVIQLK